MSKLSKMSILKISKSVNASYLVYDTFLRKKKTTIKKFRIDHADILPRIIFLSEINISRFMTICMTNIHVMTINFPMSQNSPKCQCRKCQNSPKCQYRKCQNQ